jgi:hypothetical protein
MIENAILTFRSIITVVIFFNTIAHFGGILFSIFMVAAFSGIFIFTLGFQLAEVGPFAMSLIAQRIEEIIKRNKAIEKNKVATINP